MLRSTEGLVPGVDIGVVLAQRFERIRGEVPHLALPPALAVSLTERLGTLGDSLLEGPPGGQAMRLSSETV